MTENIILQQDDCSPDSMQYFEEEFIKKFGISFVQWKKKATYENIDDGYGFEYTLDGIKASIYADDPWWKITKINN